MTKANRIPPALNPDARDASVLLTTQKDNGTNSIHLTLALKIDLALLRRQKRALIGLHEGSPVSSEQEEAAEGMLNMIDFIQDSILDQQLATEQDIFPSLPSLFDVV
jgi:hypothetical protein